MWTWRFARAEPILFANVATSKFAESTTPEARRVQPRREGRHAVRPPAVVEATSSGSARCGTGRSCIKGIQIRRRRYVAADLGVDAIALSNHGGRQLDDAPAILELVAPVVDAVGGRVEIICDGGVRRGSDIVKAVALGAKACMAGRAYLYGLAAAGELASTRCSSCSPTTCAARWR